MSQANGDPIDNHGVDDAQANEETRLLLEFLHDRDATCPACGYNLRNLSRPVCPECRQDLTLTVGARRIRFEWLIVAIAPGIFSGITAGLLLGLSAFARLYDGTWPDWPFWALDAFGFASGAMSIFLFVSRYRFIRQRQSVQRAWALLIWAAHVLAFVALVTGVAVAS
jgi:uncharacterized paraquat-inducible protein A